MVAEGGPGAANPGTRTTVLPSPHPVTNLAAQARD